MNIAALLQKKAEKAVSDPEGFRDEYMDDTRKEALKRYGE